jgi:hypothetical protein
VVSAHVDPHNDERLNRAFFDQTACGLVDVPLSSSGSRRTCVEELLPVGQVKDWITAVKV